MRVERGTFIKLISELMLPILLIPMILGMPIVPLIDTAEPVLAETYLTPSGDNFTIVDGGYLFNLDTDTEVFISNEGWLRYKRLSGIKMMLTPQLSYQFIQVEAGNVVGFTGPEAEWRYYPVEEGFEFEVTLKEEVTSDNVVTFVLGNESRNLRFYRQPPLDELYEVGVDNVTYVDANYAYKDGMPWQYRPENVVESMTIYNVGRYGNEYGNGKIGSLKRPLIIDDRGTQMYGKWNYWTTDNITYYLTVEAVDAQAFSKLRYPIIVDPTIGNETIGGSTYTMNNDICGTAFYMYEDGTADNITAYHSDDDVDNKYAIYWRPTWELIDETGAVGTSSGSAGWYPLDVDSNATLYAGSWYYIIFCGDGNTGFYYDSVATAESVEYDPHTPEVALPDPLTPDSTSGQYNFSIYLNYTATDAVAHNPIIMIPAPVIITEGVASWEYVDLDDYVTVPEYATGVVIKWHNTIGGVRAYGVQRGDSTDNNSRNAGAGYQGAAITGFDSGNGIGIYNALANINYAIFGWVYEGVLSQNWTQVDGDATDRNGAWNDFDITDYGAPSGTDLGIFVAEAAGGSGSPREFGYRAVGDTTPDSVTRFSIGAYGYGAEFVVPIVSDNFQLYFDDSSNPNTVHLVGYIDNDGVHSVISSANYSQGSSWSWYTEVEVTECTENLTSYTFLGFVEASSTYMQNQDAYGFGSENSTTISVDNRLIIQGMSSRDHEVAIYQAGNAQRHPWLTIWTAPAEEAGETPDIINIPVSFTHTPWLGAGDNFTTGTSYFTVTNNCTSTAVDITIGGTDAVGGVTWTLSNTGTPGVDTYAIKAGTSDYSIVVKKTEPYNTLTSALAAGANVTWGFQLFMPTNWPDTNPSTMTANITLYAD